jgi:hypothetical protein
MNDNKRFRIVMPGGLPSSDTFFAANPQPGRIRAGCLLMTHEPSGRQITVHASRLLPAEAVGQDSHRVCLTCGKVEGVVEDEVVCLQEGGDACALVAPATEGVFHAPHEEPASRGA